MTGRIILIQIRDRKNRFVRRFNFGRVLFYCQCTRNVSHLRYASGISTRKKQVGNWKLNDSGKKGFVSRLVIQHERGKCNPL